MTEQTPIERVQRWLSRLQSGSTQELEDFTAAREAFEEVAIGVDKMWANLRDRNAAIKELRAQLASLKGLRAKNRVEVETEVLELRAQLAKAQKELQVCQKKQT